MVGWLLGYRPPYHSVRGASVKSNLIFILRQARTRSRIFYWASPGFVWFRRLHLSPKPFSFFP